MDTSSLEFGRKIITESDKLVTLAPSNDEHEGIFDSQKKKRKDKTISSSLSVSSSETVEIEAPLDDLDSVKPSRVKKRNFASINPLKSTNILHSHIDSNNFRHTTKSPTSLVQEEVTQFNELDSVYGN